MEQLWRRLPQILAQAKRLNPELVRANVKIIVPELILVLDARHLIYVL
jgi:hypothetical protein